MGGLKGLLIKVFLQLAYDRVDLNATSGICSLSLQEISPSYTMKLNKVGTSPTEVKDKYCFTNVFTVNDVTQNSNSCGAQWKTVD